MKYRLFLGGLVAALAVLLADAGATRADESLAKVAEAVNPKMVKLFGAGGIKGLPSYGSGVLISSDGYILTIYNHILDTQDLRVHLWDGTRHNAKVVATEPELDIALLKLDDRGGKEMFTDLPHYDVTAAAARPPAPAGTGILAFSNQFQIATRHEPMSVQRGVVASYSKLYGKRGIFDAPYTGDVYVLDAITNNPGAGGGIITTRKGELLGLIGKELSNELTNTWINYAVPIGAKVEVKLLEGKSETVSVLDLVNKREKYRPIDPKGKAEKGGGGYHGITFVANVVDRTPPYVEEVATGSPGAKAGLLPDDLIVYVDGIPVSSINILTETLEKYRPTDKLRVEVRRGDKLMTLTLELDVLKNPRPKPPADDKDKDK